MASKQAFSFISWNTKEFLINKLDEFYKAGILKFYFAMFHFKEVDDLEDHFHVLVYPNKAIDYSKFRVEFNEIQLNGLMPLGISAIEKKELKNCDYEAILYFMHDKRYIASKFKEQKKYTYDRKDFISPDYRTMQTKVSEAYCFTDFGQDEKINNMLNNGVSPAQLIKNGYIPIKQSCAYHHYIQMLQEVNNK